MLPLLSLSLFVPDTAWGADVRRQTAAEFAGFFHGALNTAIVPCEFPENDRSSSRAMVA
jgi:hypothetical protein